MTSMTEKLLELHPSGLVLGQAKAIVGQFGLIIRWNLPPDGNTSEVRLKEDDTLSIIRVEGDMLEVGGYVPGPVMIHSGKFKGFSYRKYND